MNITVGDYELVSIFLKSIFLLLNVFRIDRFNYRLFVKQIGEM